MNLRNSALFDLAKTRAAEILPADSYPWECLDEIIPFLYWLGEKLPEEEFFHSQEGIWIAKDAEVAPSACLLAPCIIDHGAEVRHCAFLRGGVLIGKRATAGNSTEVKNAILFDGVQIPHFNYVGDSVLGYQAHFGAGAVTSNVKSDFSLISVHLDDTVIPTGRLKFGAAVGDGAEIGCNSVLNPGTVIGRNSRVYPLSGVRGCVPENHIYKAEGQIIPKRETEKP